jgi:hypothetical protein
MGNEMDITICGEGNTIVYVSLMAARCLELSEETQCMVNGERGKVVSNE